VEPQFIPVGELVTVPFPVPAGVIANVWVVPVVKVAVTALDVDIATEHEPVPVHPPDHPVNVEPGLAVAVKVMVVALCP
jgi:hypothetical protein